MSTDERTWSVEQKPRGMTLRSNKIRVEVVRGVNAGAVFELPGPEARIGTARTCDVALADPTVSREHVLLRVEGGSMRVLDGRSKNGTWVDGVRIRDAFARPDSLLALGDTTLRLQMLDEEVETAISSRERFGHLLGSSVAMRRVFAVLERAATSRISVLIEGESGTGKELAANGIHKASSRSGGPFVVFDCSAVPSTLVESELLGHVRGAFTGAVGRPLLPALDVDGALEDTGTASIPGHKNRSTTRRLSAKIRSPRRLFCGRHCAAAPLLRWTYPVTKRMRED